MTEPYFSPLRPDGASDADGEAGTAPTDGPGRLIRRARERAGLSLGDVATQTRLTVATLDALEHDDFKTLRESVYVRGYYRKCAKVLQLSEQELIAAYERVARPAASHSMPSKLLLVSGEPERSFVPIGRSLLIVGLLVAAVAFVAVIVHRGSLRTLTPGAEPAPAAVGSSATEPVPVPVPAPSAPAAAMQQLPAQPAVPAPEAPAAQASAPPSSAAAPPAASAAAGTSGSAAVANGNALVLDFQDRSWAEITDAAGKVLLSGMIRAGSHEVLVGRPPYTVFLGNAPKVAVSYGGQPVDLSGATRENDTARLQIPAH